MSLALCAGAPGEAFNRHLLSVPKDQHAHLTVGDVAPQRAEQFVLAPDLAISLVVASARIAGGRGP